MDGGLAYEYQGVATAEALENFMIKQEYLKAEIVVDYARERSMMEQTLTFVSRLFEELIFLIDYSYGKIGLGDLSFPIKMVGFVIIFLVPCLILTILLCVAGDDEEEVPAKKAQ